MSISPLDIVETPRNRIAVVTGVVTHPAGEPQVFMRTLDENKPLQTTQQMIKHHVGYRVVGNWTDKTTREHVRENHTVSIDPFVSVETDTLPSYNP